jgi:hypothetical protein
MHFLSKTGLVSVDMVSKNLIEYMYYHSITLSYKNNISIDNNVSNDFH